MGSRQPDSVISPIFPANENIRYPGWDSQDWQQTTKPTVGWDVRDVKNRGFVAPDQYGSPDIICHRNAHPASLAAKVEAGGTLELQWTKWPTNHHGPVITYLANCDGDCSTVDKTSLKFNKIDEASMSSNTTEQGKPGQYASDKLIADGNKWTVTIPSYVAPGRYVLRHEIIALAGALRRNGAQNYPQCINIEVTGNGTDGLRSGTLGVNLYSVDEPGILLSIYRWVDYIIPGPPLYKPSEAEFLSGSAEPSTTEEGASAIYSSAPPTVSVGDSPRTPSASKDSVISTSSFVASGNYSAAAASHFKSSSIPCSTSLVPTPINTPAPIVTKLDLVVVFQTLTSIRTATLQPIPSAHPVIESSPSKEEPSLASSSESKAQESSTSHPPPKEEYTSSSSESDESAPGEKKNFDKTPPAAESHGPHPSSNHPTSFHEFTINELLNLLGGIIKQLKKKLVHEIHRRHTRDIIP